MKREADEGVYSVVLQRLSDMVKTGLFEPQCPVVESAHPSVARLHTDEAGSYGIRFSSVVRLGRQTANSEFAQGHEWGTYVALARSLVTEHEIAYGARALR